MKTAKMLTILVVALGLIVCSVQVSEAQPLPMGTAFTYQGHLYDANYVANGLYDFQFKLFNDSNVVDGNQIGDNVNKANVDVIDGYFTVELDFNSPEAFIGEARWLEIGVRPGELEDPNAYTPLSPLQEVTPTPYATYAKTAGGVPVPFVLSGSVASPEAVIKGTNTGTGYGVYGYNDSGGGVYGRSWSGDGVVGVSDSAKGVYGYSWGGDGGHFESDFGYAGHFESDFGYGLIVESGDVGIGTTSPGTKLHVYEPSSSDVYMSVEASSSDGEAGVRLKNPAGGWDVFANEGNGDFGISHALSDRVLTIKKTTGNVGIGTESPQGVLDVNGPIYQRGGVLHADYVFESDYELESLDEHSKFMWQNKHLPAVPKVQMDEAGQEIIEVGAHRRGIVEELEKAHIYIEQLHNQNKALEKRVAALEKMVLHQRFVSAKEVYNETD